MIFCFGSRRSGTFLLHRIVAAHPDVSAIPSETHLFSHGIRPLLERFHHGARDSSQVGAMYADRDLLLDATRDFCDRVFAPYLEPGRARLVERTPLHALHADLIAEVYPDASFVHIVRDGRDVARSLISHGWGPGSIAEAASEWREAVMAGRTIAGHERYLELRYEDLIAESWPSLERLYGELGLPRSQEALAAAEGALAEKRNLAPGESDVSTGKWRSAWSARDVQAFERAAGDTLRELGYPGVELGRRPRPSLSELARPLRRVLDRGDRRPADGPVPAHAGRPEILLDRLLTAARRGRGDEAARLLAPDAELCLETADGVSKVRGAGAATALRAALADDPALRARQIESRILPGEPTAVGSFLFELPDGSRTERLIAIHSDGERIASLIVSRLSSR
jgi:hypothetical protein